MSERTVFVFVDLKSGPCLVGRLWSRLPDDPTASLDLALAYAEYFELDATEARQIAALVGRAVSGWRNRAAQLGLSGATMKRMESAFEHRDLEQALEMHS